MSLHKVPLTELEREGLLKHGLSVDAPSQMSDAFRLGMHWAKQSLSQNAKRYEWIRHGDNDEKLIQRGEIDIDLVYLPRNELLDTLIDFYIEQEK